MRRAIGPAWSHDHASETTPWREQRPYVPLTPDTPHIAAGLTIEQPVSVPSAAGTIRPARAAPDPPELPPGLRSVSHGFTVGGLLGPQANSVLDSLPRRTMPALLQAGPHRGVEVGDEVLQDLGTGRGGDALGVVQVLQPDRHPGQAPDRPAERSGLVGRLRPGQRHVEGLPFEGFDRRLQPLDAGDARLDQFPGGKLPPLQQRKQLHDGQVRRIGRRIRRRDRRGFRLRPSRANANDTGSAAPAANTCRRLTG